MDIYNVHIHTFKEEDIPRKFLPLQLVRILSTKIGFKIVAKILNFLNPFSTDDKMKKYLRFVETGKLGSQEEIFLQCASQYPDTAKFAIHSMDMSAMNAGKVPRNFMDQFKELIQLQNKYFDNIYSFVHIEPNNPNYLSIFYEAVELGACGVKLYPPASCFLPTDNRLDVIYKYCEDNDLPIMAHCSAQSPTHYHDSKKNLRKKLDLMGLKWTEDMDVTELCGQFTRPDLYIPVLEKYPKLRICLGHWGSELAWEEYMDNPSNKENWFYIIKDMLQKYPNVFTDISFTLNNEQYFSVLKVYLQNPKILPQVLFGTDYYMVETETSEKQFCFNLRGYLGEELFNAIANVNPKRYLG